MEGYRVQTACNGHEAIQCLSHFKPKFVLLDMMMPECGGRDNVAADSTDAGFRQLPIFAVSGSSPDSVGLSIGEVALSSGFPKPLNAPRLMQHMRDRVASLSLDSASESVSEMSADLAKMRGSHPMQAF